MRGVADESTLIDVDQHRHPGWRYLHYEHTLVHAWVAAAQGAVSQAAELASNAAHVAADNGQWAAEVLCRQTAAQFGDPSGAQRLGELAAHVDGPRAGAAAAFAHALRREDADALVEVSAVFERIGDLVAAADAAAHASMVHRRKNRRGSALGQAHHAEKLADRCGAATPAVVACLEHLPLTDREREIVTLLAAGGVQSHGGTTPAAVGAHRRGARVPRDVEDRLRLARRAHRPREAAAPQIRVTGYSIRAPGPVAS